MKGLPVLACLSFLVGCGGPGARTPDPEPSAAAEAVAYPAGKDTVKGLVFRPAGKGPSPALVAVHGEFGLTDGVKQHARRLADMGYVVLAVDLYRGDLPADLMEAHILDRGLPDERVLADLKGAVSYLAGRSDVRAGAVGIIGWDMGGGYALDAALADPRLRAVVTCYGRLTTDADLLAPLEASVLGIFGGKDEGISAGTIEEFRAAMRKAGKRVAGIHVYPDCAPGFLDPAGQSQAARGPARDVADAWSRIEAYLAAELKS